MKLTAETLFPVILTLDSQEKERLVIMINTDLEQELIKTDSVVYLNIKSIQYLIIHFERAYQRYKQKNSL